MLNLLKQKFNSFRQLFFKLPKLHRKLIIVLSIACLLLIILPGRYHSGPGYRVEVSLPELHDPKFDEALNAEQFKLTDISFKSIPDFEWKVREGDTLGELFSLLRMSNTLTKIQEADKNVLSLDVINKGDIYRFWLKGNNDNFDGSGLLIDRMEQYLGIEHQVVFQRKGSGFEYKETLLEGNWRKVPIVGQVQSRSSFSQSAVPLGLPVSDVSVIRRLLKNQIDLGKVLAGDKFQVIISKQFIGDKATGNTKVEGVRFFNRKSIYSAFAYEGNYFDSKGEGLERAFTRYPLKPGKRRISSNFNPRRRHPITRLIRPHNGTDFAVPTGTPIFAPGDGVVKRVVRHKYAGLYIELQHSYKYRTRYLHLSKSLVKKGQRIKRGQKIALSGNTGASTGPHLHYEFHVNQKPINAMGNKVPVSIGVDKKSMVAYKRRVSSLIRMMEAEDVSNIAVNKDKANKS